MSYTIEDLNASVEGFGDSATAWGPFRQLLLATGHPVVNVPGIGGAHLLDDFQPNGTDESSVTTGGQAWFVFSVTDSLNAVRQFKRSGHGDGFDYDYDRDGIKYEGPTVEVTPIQTQTTTWQEI